MRNNCATFASYARPLLRANLNALLKERAGVIKNRDIEYLHRMRVASRRLRTSLWLCKSLYHKKQYRSLKTRIRSITTLLGEARDLDTHLAFLNKPCAPLTATLLRERGVLQHKICATLHTLDRSCLRKDITAFTRTNTFSPDTLVKNKIIKRLEALKAFNSSCCKETESNALHRLRIASKHLRYCLEQSNCCFTPGLRRYILAAKKIQDTLGDVHNFEVWGAQARRYQGTTAFVKICLGRRRKAYQQFKEAWRMQSKAGIWNTLEQRCA